MTAEALSVLVVDDDFRMQRMIRRILEMENYRVRVAGNGEEALDSFTREPADIILLDIAMPEPDGYEVCRRIREFSQTPIIMVTASDGDDDKVAGLDAGADDYITKPFSAQELTARVRAVIRRATLWGEPTEPLFEHEDLTIDFSHRRVTMAGQEVILTATEFRLLAYLAHNAARVVTTRQILERVWGDEYLDETHILQVNVARLRRKLGDDSKNPRHIFTRPGIGYLMPR
jgi:DNA-binding response OmpR family regulator